MEYRSAQYHRAAAARARRLLAEATTPWVKQQLSEAIERHDQIVAEIERASGPDGDAVSSREGTSALEAKPPGRSSEGPTRFPFRTTGISADLSAGDCSNLRLN